MKILMPNSIIITSSNVTPSSYAEWNNTTAYAIGTCVYLPADYGEYKCIVANTGVDPRTSLYDANNTSGKWQFLGTANKYKMFDQFLNTQTVKEGQIINQIACYGSQAFYLGNIEAMSVTIDIIDNQTLEVIESYSKNLFPAVSDWKDYFYGDWIAKNKGSILYERTTLSLDVSAIITIDNGTDEAKCGVFVCGETRNIGNSKWGVKIGALDYSTVLINTATGATYLSKGNYAKTLDIDIFAKTPSVLPIYQALVDARGIPIVLIPGYDDDLLTTYCYIQSHETILNSPVETAINCKAIGLI